MVKGIVIREGDIFIREGDISRREGIISTRKGIIKGISLEACVQIETICAWVFL